MIVSKVKVLLFGLAFLKIVSISATEKEDHKKDDLKGSSPSLTVVKTEAPILAEPEPFELYNQAVDLMTKTKGLAPEQMVPLLRGAVDMLTRSSKGGDKEAKDILPECQSYLAMALTDSASSLTPDQQISRLREALDLFAISARPNQMHKDKVFTVQYYLALALWNWSKTRTPDKRIPPLREAIAWCTTSREGGCKEAKIYLNDIRADLAQLLFERSVTVDLNASLDDLRETEKLLLAWVAEDNNISANSVLIIIRAALTSKSAKLEN